MNEPRTISILALLWSPLTWRVRPIATTRAALRWVKRNGWTRIGRWPVRWLPPEGW